MAVLRSTLRQPLLKTSRLGSVNRSLEASNASRVRCASTAVAPASAKPSINDARQRPNYPLAGSVASESSLESRLERIRSAPSFSSFLTDSFSRQHNYLRISITERCNLRCTYCMPEEGVPLSPPSHNLTTPEILLLSELFVSQGVNKIRLTGGEPTVRKDFLSLLQQIGRLRDKGLKELCITTNGVSLWRKLDAMAEAGLSGVNLSLDTLDPHLFQIMTRRNGFDAVIKSMNKILDLKAHGASIKLKINAVVMRGVNDHEILPFVELGREKDIEVRFIEYMPFDGNKWARKKMFGYEEMLGVIRSKYPSVARLKDRKGETSKTWQVPGFAGKIGFITSMTENFCGTCNRLRITSDGNLKVCLFGNAEVSLRDLLRDGNGQTPIDDDAYRAMIEIEGSRRVGANGFPVVLQDPILEGRLLDVIGKAVGRKKAKHAGMGELEKMPNRPMILIDDLQRSFTQGNSANVGSRHVNKLIMTTTLPPTPTGTRLPGPRAQYFSTSARASLSPSRTLSSEDGKGNTNRTASLPHLTAQSTAHMVSVSDKPVTRRTATAVGHVAFSNPEVLHAIRSHLNKKGDVLGTARVAGIMGAKRCADIIPLCHPGLGIEHVSVEVEAVDAPDTEVEPGTSPRPPYLKRPIGEHGGVRIQATVVCEGKTGIEMEAFTAVTAAALTVVDMCKAMDKRLLVEGVKMVRKEGGRSGTFVDPTWQSGY